MPADDVAEAAGTNGYEVLTSLGRRFHRPLPAARERPSGCARARSGARSLGACRIAGALALFALDRPVASGAAALLWPRCSCRALVEIGYFSLPVVALTAIFTGMVLALQSLYRLRRASPPRAPIASVVVLSVTRELGPVLAGLMVAGRVGAAMAAEIGTMRVTDQIDALTTLSTNPMKYLVAPRLLAGIIALPLLVVVADILGVLGGFIVATLQARASTPPPTCSNTHRLRADRRTWSRAW